MARKTKCPICEMWFDRDTTDSTPKGKRWCHTECLSEESTDRKDLTKYICKLFSYDYLPDSIKRQIAKYKRDNKLTEKEILEDLIYWYDVRKESLEKSKGRIGIVPHIHEEAQIYYKKRNYIEQKKVNEAKIAKEVVNKKKIRTISVSDILKERSIKEKKKEFIDLSEWEG